MNRPVAFLDSCVLYPFSLRDLLIQFAVDGLFQAKWSLQVRDQVIRNVESKNPTTRGKLDRTFDLMEKAIFEYSAEANAESMKLVSGSKTKPEDQKILAAAIAGNCSYLVTANIKDFDLPFALANGVKVTHPDDFLDSLILNDPEVAESAFCKILKRWKNPPVTVEQYLKALRANLLIKTANRLAAF